MAQAVADSKSSKWIVIGITSLRALHFAHIDAPASERCDDDPSAFPGVSGVVLVCGIAVNVLTEHDRLVGGEFFRGARGQFGGLELSFKPVQFAPARMAQAVRFGGIHFAPNTYP